MKRKLLEILLCVSLLLSVAYIPALALEADIPSTVTAAERELPSVETQEDASSGAGGHIGRAF